MSETIRVEIELDMNDRNEIVRLANIMKCPFARMAGAIIRCGLEKTNAKVP